VDFSRRANSTNPAPRLAALNYLSAGAGLSRKNWRERWRELIFALELNRAECEFLTRALAAAEERLNVLSARAATTVEGAKTILKTSIEF
jgi:hypothetical protein